MNDEILQEIKDNNQKLDEVIQYQDMLLDELVDINNSVNVTVPRGDDPQPDYNTSYSFKSYTILSLIFGFIVGYCLIKSFFDGLKI